MGCDTYLFGAFSTSGLAVLLFNSEIKEAYKQRSSATDKAAEESEQQEDAGTSGEPKKVTPRKGARSTPKRCEKNPLSEDEKKWLWDQAQGFRLYGLGDTLTLLMKAESHLHQHDECDVPGPYEIEDEYRSVRIKIVQDSASNPVEYEELVSLAQRLTPVGMKPPFHVGRYLGSMTKSYLMEIKEISPPDTLQTNEKDVMDETVTENHSASCEIPTDFELIVGKVEKQKTIKTFKDVLMNFLPGFGDLMAQSNTDEISMTLELPELDPEAVELVLEICTTRNTRDAKSPSRWSDKDLFLAVEKVKQSFGLSDESSKSSPPAKKVKTSDHQYQTVTFLAGSDKEEVKAKRYVVAAMNPVLSRILFGTGTMTVDPMQPIDWSMFEVGAVRAILSALMERGQKDVVVPLECVDSAKELVDYLIETRSSLNLYYETPFRRGYEGGVTLTYNYCLGETGNYEECFEISSR